MKIIGQKTEAVQVEVAEYTILEYAKGIVRDRLKLGATQWVEDGKIKEEQYTSHSYTVTVGIATPEQIEGWKVFEYLNKEQHRKT